MVQSTVMYALWGRCLKRATASPRSTSLADPYASTAIPKVNPPMNGSSSELDLTIARRSMTMVLAMAAKGKAAIGITVTVSDATRQSFCSAGVGKEKSHPAQ